MTNASPPDRQMTSTSVHDCIRPNARLDLQYCTVVNQQEAGAAAPTSFFRSFKPRAARAYKHAYLKVAIREHKSIGSYNTYATLQPNTNNEQRIHFLSQV